MNKLQKIGGFSLAFVLCLGIIFWVWVKGFFIVLPPLLSNLPETNPQAQVAFRERIQQRFPVGSSEAELLSVLAKQRFDIQKSQNSAGYSVEKWPCTYKWRIDWDSSQDGKILRLNASYGAVCI